MWKFFHRRCDDYRDLGGSSNRTRLYCQPIHRQVSQPDGDVGKVSSIVVQDYLTHLVPVSSCTDGWRSCRPILGYSSEGDECDLNSFLTELLKKKIKFFSKSLENILQKISDVQLIDSQVRFLIFSSDFSIFKKSAIRLSLIFQKAKNQTKKSEKHIDNQHLNTFWFFEGSFKYFIFSKFDWKRQHEIKNRLCDFIFREGVFWYPWLFSNCKKCNRKVFWDISIFLFLN